MPDGEMGHYISNVFGPTKFHVGNLCPVNRKRSSTLQAESIRSSLQHLEIGILSVSACDSGVCYDS